MLLIVFLSVSLYCLFSVPSSVNGVSPRCVSVMCRLFVMSGLVVLRRLHVVVGGVCEMFCGLLVMFCSFP